jgi:hypothetical protein
VADVNATFLGSVHNWRGLELKIKTKQETKKDKEHLDRGHRKPEQKVADTIYSI